MPHTSCNIAMSRCSEAPISETFCYPAKSYDVFQTLDEGKALSLTLDGRLIHRCAVDAETNIRLLTHMPEERSELGRSEVVVNAGRCEESQAEAVSMDVPRLEHQLGAGLRKNGDDDAKGAAIEVFRFRSNGMHSEVVNLSLHSRKVSSRLPRHRSASSTENPLWPNRKTKGKFNDRRVGDGSKAGTGAGTRGGDDGGRKQEVVQTPTAPRHLRKVPGVKLTPSRGGRRRTLVDVRQVRADYGACRQIPAQGTLTGVDVSEKDLLFHRSLGVLPIQRMNGLHSPI
ncbi:hypothetical protein B0H19DRAFT_1241017 [Mycena capillaripes]|nr:hypothetical protein B0H19DRAFT_1241017 [Mycena capillaripes]